MKFKKNKLPDLFKLFFLSIYTNRPLCEATCSKRVDMGTGKGSNLSDRFQLRPPNCKRIRNKSPANKANLNINVRPNGSEVSQGRGPWPVKGDSFALRDFEKQCRTTPVASISRSYVNTLVRGISTYKGLWNPQNIFQNSWFEIKIKSTAKKTHIICHIYNL